MQARGRRNLAAWLMVWAPAAGALAGGPVASVGMAGAHSGLADGAMALGVNPANLAMADSLRWGVELLAVGAELSNNGLGWDLYGRATDAEISPEDKRAILAAIPESGWQIQADLQANALGFQWGNLAVATRAQAQSRGNIPQAAIELFLYGNAVVDSLELAEADGEVLALASADLGVAVPLLAGDWGRLCVGTTVRWLEAVGYARLRETKGLLITRPDGARASLAAEVLTARSGRGYSGDAGVSVDLRGGFRAGLAIRNLWGRLRMTRGLTRHSYTADVDSLTLADLTGGPNQLAIERIETQDVEAFPVDLPRTLRAGLAVRRHSFDAAIDVAVPMERSSGDDARALMAVGIEFRGLDWLPLRFGIARGGRVRRAAAVGLGLRLGAVHWDAALSASGPRLPADASGLGIATGLRLRF